MAKEYEFINSIRCIAMISIVAEHCVSAGGFEPGSTSHLYWPFLIMMQTVKFGTISFFLLAGFLISEKFTAYSPFEYYQRRIVSVFRPWLFWSMLYVVIDMLFLLARSIKRQDNRFNLHNIYNNIKGLYLLSNYWFVINYLVCIGLLLIFRRHLYSIYLGFILFLLSLFYSLNIYNHWIPPGHTTAIFGFVFFVWLGAQMRKHWAIVEKWIKKTPVGIPCFLIIGTFFLSIFEGHAIAVMKQGYLNTLRFSNILYSLSFFLLLLKFEKFTFIQALRPRDTTYGIYLIHYILIVFLLPFIFPGIKIERLSAPHFLLHRLVCFVIVYYLTFKIVLILIASKAKRLVGN